MKILYLLLPCPCGAENWGEEFKNEDFSLVGVVCSILTSQAIVWDNSTAPAWILGTNIPWQHLILEFFCRENAAGSGGGTQDGKRRRNCRAGRIGAWALMVPKAKQELHTLLGCSRRKTELEMHLPSRLSPCPAPGAQAGQRNVLFVFLREMDGKCRSIYLSLSAGPALELIFHKPLLC